MPKSKLPPSKLAALSVQDRADVGFRDESPLTFHIAGVADEIPQYWSRDRDVALDKFWKTEPILAGAIYSMSAKVAALDFNLVGPEKAKSRYRNVLLSADYGGGWVNFIPKVVQDLLASDNGGFIELLRPPNSSPQSSVVSIAHLDSHRARRTGSPEIPVQYRSVKEQEWRNLNWWEVIPLADMPSPREELKGVGFCATSRVMRAAQVLRDIGLRKRQKLAGKRVPAILFVQGIRRNAVRDALKETMEEQMSRGESHYTGPAIIASPDPARPVSTQLVELAGLPEGYNEDITLKWYIATVALGFGTDYTEFAPLPGGGLGTATQSTEMAARSRGKGPGVILQQLEFAINWFILPETVTFQFASTDPIAEQERVNLRLLRARERRERIQSGEITVEQALQLAIEEGDAPPEFAAGGADQLTQTELMVKDVEGLMADWAVVERELAKSNGKVATIKDVVDLGLEVL